ncbi:MAG: ComF family protein [Legionellales bacterium]|nr:ComF family protein [Legionellales bacterium]
MRRIIASISHVLRLSSICLICEQYHPGHLALCEACLHLLIPIEHACTHCALPLPEGQFLVCGPCSQKTPLVDRTYAPYRFEEPLRSLIHSFKYHEGLYLSSFLASLMMTSIPLEAQKTECLIPVPMHPQRLKERGFNQSAELTKHLGRHFNIPYELAHCKKIRNTLPQASLNANERLKNLREAFQANPLPYHHITLIDDLFTTGCTVNELALVLKKQGVKRVDVWCCARVIPRINHVRVLF